MRKVCFKKENKAILTFLSMDMITVLLVYYTMWLLSIAHCETYIKRRKNSLRWRWERKSVSRYEKKACTTLSNNGKFAMHVMYPHYDECKLLKVIFKNVYIQIKCLTSALFYNFPSNIGIRISYFFSITCLNCGIFFIWSTNFSWEA